MYDLHRCAPAQINEYREKHPDSAVRSKPAAAKRTKKAAAKRSEAAEHEGDAASDSDRGEERGDVGGAIIAAADEIEPDSPDSPGRDTVPAAKVRRPTKRKAAQAAEKGITKSARGEGVVEVVADQPEGPIAQGGGAKVRKRLKCGKTEPSTAGTKTVAAGLKQQDLNEDDDLLHTEFVSLNPTLRRVYYPSW
jgi:hypothetical protein